MSTFLQWALYLFAVPVGFLAATLAVVAAAGARRGERPLARAFGLYSMILACAVTLMILAAGDLR